VDEQDREDYSDYDQTPTAEPSPPVVLPALTAVAVVVALTGVSFLVVALLRG
jgi:hypothetical protein